MFPFFAALLDANATTAAPSSSLIIGDRMGKYVTRYAVTVKERTNYTPQLLNNYIPPAAANNTLVGYLFIEKKGNMTIDPFPHITSLFVITVEGSSI